ncbi:MAG: hypothetical protein JWN67_4729 [Actinomycetia bacterium]|nr:hypothetical protein [Actinomycetes bacterium]
MLFTAVTIGIHGLIDADGGTAWSQALTAAGTLALLLVTGIYAFLTYLLVKAQERSVAATIRSEREKPTRRLLEQLPPMILLLVSAQNAFPLAEDERPLPPSRFANKEIMEASTVLRSMATQLHPDCRLTALELANAYADVGLALKGLQGWAGGVDEDATVEAVWLRIRHQFYEDESLRRALSLGNERLPEWSDLASGALLETALDKTRDLEDNLDDALQAEHWHN